MKFNTQYHALIFLLLLLLTAAVGWQEENGIYGVVRSHAGAGNGNGEVAEATVAAYDVNGTLAARTLSAATGEYRIIVPEGHYRIVVEHDDYSVFDTHEAIIQVQQGHFTLFNIAMRPLENAASGRLQGRVQDALGSPLEDATITITTLNGQPVSGTSTDEDGSFALDLENGSYTVVAQHPGLEEVLEETVVIEAITTTELTLRPAEPAVETGTIQGIVRARTASGEIGRPVTGAVVTARNRDTSQEASTTTNEIGYYQLSVPEGSYLMVATHETYDNSGDQDNTTTVIAGTPTTWNTFLSIQDGTVTGQECRQRLPVSIGASYGERHIVYLKIDQPGVLTVEYRWTGDANSLSLVISSPDGTSRRIDGRSPLSLTVEVSSDHIAQGSQWELSVINFMGGSGSGTLSATYPCEEQ